jgi:signal transduction histidine kinase/CheY-like chemotaxis protein
MRPRPQQILDYREYPVLCVDDEPENLRIFELGFRREFSIVTAQSGEEGLRILQTQPVAVVLSDHRMPGMSGVEFLGRVRELDPKTMRVIVTAYGDAETLGAAINDGSIYKYVPKPWTPEEMRLALRRAIELYALDRERDELLRELTMLNRVSQSINQQLDLARLQDLILSTVIDDLGYDAATLFLFDTSGHRLMSRATAPMGGVSTWLRQLQIHLRDAPRFVKGVAEGETQTLVHERLADYEPPVREWVTEVAADAMLVLPLVGKDRVIGALVVDNRRGGARFEVADRTLLEGLATQASIALENARLVEDLRRSREQVARADRLGTLGTLAAGLAHEINNPLTSIHTFLSLAPEKRAEEDPEFWGGYHALATREVERIRGLVASMERLARGGGSEARREPVKPAEVAEGAARLLAREAQRRNVRLELEFEDGLPTVSAVRDQVHQVLLNLILNAIHASPSGARVLVRVLRAETDAGPAVALEVEDQGPGIATEDLERIFDPFFTTKDPDQGTGLGLTICQQLVANHDGSIEVRSAPDAGATFRVLLPCGLPDA